MSPPSSEALVPTGRPYGERKQLEGQMARAGLPAAPSSSGAAGAPQAPVPGQPAPAAPAMVPPGFDTLTGRQPSQPQLVEDTPPQTHRQVLQELAANSPNPFYREYAARLLQVEQ